jgi:hypothetical protein
LLLQFGDALVLRGEASMGGLELPVQRNEKCDESLGVESPLLHILSEPVDLLHALSIANVANRGKIAFSKLTATVPPRSSRRL